MEKEKEENIRRRLILVREKYSEMEKEKTYSKERNIWTVEKKKKRGGGKRGEIFGEVKYFEEINIRTAEEKKKGEQKRGKYSWTENW